MTSVPPESHQNDIVPKTESAGLDTAPDNTNGDATTPSTTAQAPATGEEPTIDVTQLKNEFQEKARNYLLEQTSHVIIPSFAKWFDLDEIHSIEEKSFPDFFNNNSGSLYKSPEAYKNIRDFLINAYRINPIEYLTITAARRNLAGDVTTIIRIHQFLEKWGLINYQIDPRTKSSIVGPQYTGHFQITLDTPTGLVPLIPEKAEVVGPTSNSQTLPSPQPEQNDIKQEKKTDSVPLNLEFRRNIYSTSNSKITGKNNTIVQYLCNICGKDATTVRYHNLKIKTYTHNASSTINSASILCHLCYGQGLFPSNFQASDFVKLHKNDESEDWTEQEVLLLLEGIEMFGTYDTPTSSATNGSIFSNANSQWEKIAEHVGTKTKEQSLIKFIQLPIEDKFLNRLVEGKDEKSEAADGAVSDTLISEIAKKIITEQQGKDVLKTNATKNLQDSILEQSNLINQITELTLQKFNHKLGKLENLQESLLKIENQLNLERKQVLIERWVQFEKIQKIKQERPELSEILDDLITPVRVNEISKSLNLDKNGEKLTEASQQTSQVEVDKLPVSYSKPKSYQYWSG